MSVFRNWKKRHFGFFEYNFLGFDVTDFIDTSWDPIVRQKVVQYIKEGVFHIASPDGEFHNCLFCGKEVGAKTVILTDGMYIWSAYLWHYVALHGIRLPDDLFDHIVKNMYHINKSETMNEDYILDIMKNFFE